MSSLKAIALSWLLLPDDAYLHSSRVARGVTEYTPLGVHNNSANEFAVTCAYLHDVIEDSKATKAELELFFDPDVAATVQLLTRGKPPETYEQYIARIAESGNETALMVKLADLQDNLVRCREKPEGRVTLIARYTRAIPIIECALEELRA